MEIDVTTHTTQHTHTHTHTHTYIQYIYKRVQKSMCHLTTVIVQYYIQVKFSGERDTQTSFSSTTCIMLKTAKFILDPTFYGCS